MGNPLRFVLGPGNEADCARARELVEGFDGGALLADKGYDSDAIVQMAEESGMQAVIPSRKNRRKPRPLDVERYRARHLVENLFQRLKVFHRVASRFEKLDATFLAFVHLAGAMILMA